VSAPFAVYEAGQRRQAEQGRALLAALRGQAALVMIELHGVDESGHGWGGASDASRRAATEADELIRSFASALDLDRDTLVVTADHGHVGVGGHGGPEDEVLHVPLVLAGAGVRAGVRGTARQVDVAPTLSTLLGLAIPSSNQGRPLLDALLLDGERRTAALRAVLAQREPFVAGYLQVLAALDDARAASAEAAPVAATPVVSAPVASTADEGALSARLDALDAQEAAARQARRTRERRARVLPALLLALAPLAAAGALIGLGVIRGGETWRAAQAAVAALALYHLALPALGLRYSLSAVNKDEWLPFFFRKDMALGLAVCAVAVAAGAWRERRGQGARLFDLARFAWLVTAAFCTTFLVKTAVVYWEQGAATRWTIPDMRWAFAFYLDVLVLMAVGVLSPLMALPAWLAARSAPPASPAPELTREVV
jgi:hypothetical protein